MFDDTSGAVIVYGPGVASSLANAAELTGGSAPPSNSSARARDGSGREDAGLASARQRSRPTKRLSRNS